ncbi:hypothetical protein [Thermofilum pendens]|uniref:PaREP7 n=1 Tax=Thermofilum pendens (strain DSM 2475 / Hrk 5) TaxID=368408 RepID=A1S0F8_THEPD|nr:hypothetical protein [Thermofilum pendens]ABL78938.1 paREP7 [Thermofilum pendens Hrk 5]
MAALGRREWERLIKALEEDRELRYALAGLLGFRDLLEKMDATLSEIKALREGQEQLWRKQEKLWGEVRKLWEEVRALREDQRKLWEEVKALRENQEKLWEEVKSLREGQGKLWEEVKALREDQRRLWEEVKALRENQEKLWEEVRALREDQGKLWEGQQRLWEEVRALREGQERLRGDVDGLRASFRQLGEAVGMTLEFYAAAFLERLLAEKGYPEARVRVGVNLAYKGVLVELDLFCEEPLLVGEVTTYLRSAEDAEREAAKLMERVKVVEEISGRKVELAVLAVANLGREALEVLEKLHREKGVLVVTGRELEYP